MGKKRTKSPVRKGRKRRKGKQIEISIWIIAAVIASLTAFILWPYVSDRSSTEKGAAVPEGTYRYGLDISHYQEKIVWDSLMVLTDGAGRTIRSKTIAKDIRPISFVFIKATEGASMKDRNFRKHWKAAEERKIPKGAYHFFRSSKSGAVQARHFIRTAGKLGPDDLPPVLDIETIHTGCSINTLNDRALEWLETVSRHYGCKPIVYSSASFIKDILCDEIKENYPIWVAHYGKERPECRKWQIWQFTDQAIVYGIEGYCDLNVCPAGFLESLK